MYPLLLLLGLASTYLLLGALQKGKFLRWAAYALVTGLSFYAHYFALLLPPLHLLYLVVMRAGWRKVIAWLGAMAGAALMFLPWVLLLVSSIQTARFDAITSFLRSFPISFTPFGLAAGLTIFFGIFLVGYQPASHLAAIGYTIAAWPVLALLSVTSRRFSGWKRSRTVAFLALWPALFTGLVLVLAAWNPGVWLHRYMIMVTPPLFLLLALGLSRVIHRQVVALGLILVAFTSLTVLNNMEEGNPARDDFRAASRVVSSDFANGETVIVVPQFATGPFEYYFHDDAAVAPLPWTEVPSRALENVRNVMKERGGRSFWIVLRHADQIWVGSEVTSQLPDLLDGAFVFLARDQVGNVEVRHYRIPPEGR